MYSTALVDWANRKMRHANNEKQETTHDGRNRTTEPRKNQNDRRKGNLQILGNIGHHQTSGDKIKIKKEYIKRNRNYSKANHIAEISSKR